MTPRYTGQLLTSGFVLDLISIFFYLRGISSPGDEGSVVFAGLLLFASIVCWGIALYNIGHTIDIRHTLLVREFNEKISEKQSETTSE